MNHARIAGWRMCRRLFWPLQFRAVIWSAIFGILAYSPPGSVAAAQTTVKNVLLLFSSVERNTGLWDPIEPMIRDRVPGQITFYRSYLEISKADDQTYLESQAETFRRTYAGVKLDLVITGNTEELLFAVRYRDKMFPGVPIVFQGVSSRELEGQKIWPGVTGVAVPVGIRETIDLALHLHPDTNTVAVITNVTSLARYWLGITHAELLRHQDKVRVIDIVAPPSGQLLERVATLPPHTVVLFHLAPETSSHPAFGAWDLLTAVAQRLPTYSAWPALCLNYGCVGGAYEDAPKEVARTGDIAARILSGERPDDIPVVNAADLQVRVDWRALRRWNIPESALPAGTQILYREATLWQRTRKYAIAAIAVMMVQSLLIFGLLWQRERKRKAEAALHASEKRFRRRLFEAQEEERRRIARELHDDISQKLALLSSEIDLASLSENGSPEVSTNRLEEIRQHCSDIAADVQSLSHQLHNSKLDYLGVVAAIRSLCKEVGKQCAVSVEFNAENVPTELPKNVSLCLFRVAQEALHNAVKYSGTKKFEVELRAAANEVELVVTDSGAGFDVEEATTNRGLGLVSMRERVHLVRGQLAIESRPGVGTRIIATVPLSDSDMDTSATAGDHQAVGSDGTAGIERIPVNDQRADRVRAGPWSVPRWLHRKRG